jgi:hypothetical protein
MYQRSIMKKLSGGLIVVMLLLAMQSNSLADTGNSAIARRIAGSFLIHADLVGAPIPLQALATLGADGGVVATDTDDFGNGFAFGFHSPKHGVWKQTGNREVTIKVLEFAYDQNGTLTTIFKLTFIAQFDSGYQAGSGNVSFDAFLPSQDALNPNEIPVASGDGDFTFKRIAL